MCWIPQISLLFSTNWLFLLESAYNCKICLSLRICMAVWLGTWNCNLWMMCCCLSLLTKVYFLSQRWWEESDEALKRRVPQTHHHAVNEQLLSEKHNAFVPLVGCFVGWVGWWRVCRDMEDVRGFEVESFILGCQLPLPPFSLSACPSLLSFPVHFCFRSQACLTKLRQQHLFSCCCVVFCSVFGTFAACLMYVWASTHMQTILKAVCVRVCVTLHFSLIFKGRLLESFSVLSHATLVLLMRFHPRQNFVDNKTVCGERRYVYDLVCSVGITDHKFHSGELHKYLNHLVYYKPPWCNNFIKLSAL